MSAGQAQWFDFPAIDWESLFHPTFSYQYFRQRLPIPELTGTASPSEICTPLTAAWVADAAMLAYGRDGDGVMDLLEFDELLNGIQLRGHRIGNWSPDAKSVKAFFAYNQQFAVLAFRGTKKINWINSAVDLAAFPVSEKLVTDSPSPESIGRGPGNPEKQPVLVHSGFQFALDTLWPDIGLCLESYRKRYPGSPILFAGHSLGAAFATMAVARFRGGRAALYTFGSPRVGNKAFCEHVRDRADLGIFRFVNNRDVMTTIPPRERSYEHTNGLVHIGPDGKVMTGCETQDDASSGITEVLHDAAVLLRDYIDKQQPPPELLDHAQRRYCYYIWRWARNGQVP